MEESRACFGVVLVVDHFLANARHCRPHVAVTESAQQFSPLSRPCSLAACGLPLQAGFAKAVCVLLLLPTVIQLQVHDPGWLLVVVLLHRWGAIFYITQEYLPEVVLCLCLFAHIGVTHTPCAYRCNTVSK
jgi:hypothetical protein